MTYKEILEKFLNVFDGEWRYKNRDFDDKELKKFRRNVENYVRRGQYRHHLEEIKKYKFVELYMIDEAISDEPSKKDLRLNPRSHVLPSTRKIGSNRSSS